MEYSKTRKGKQIGILDEEMRNQVSCFGERRIWHSRRLPIEKSTGDFGQAQFWGSNKFDSFSLPLLFKSKNFSTANLVEKIRLVVMDKDEFEYKDLSKMRAFWNFRGFKKTPRQGANSLTIKSNSPSKEKSLQEIMQQKIQSVIVENFNLQNIKNVKTNSSCFAFLIFKLFTTRKKINDYQPKTILQQKLCPCRMQNLVRNFKLVVTETKSLHLVINQNKWLFLEPLM